MRRTVVRILLVEDNPADADLTSELLEEAPVPPEVHVARDGDEALSRLRGGRVRPNLILLDLNLPGMDGREVLEALKADPDLRRIPVVVLTTSAAPADLAHAYEHHASACLRKPVRLGEYLKLIERFGSFWLRYASFPGP